MSGPELTEDKIERIREEIRRTFPRFDENSREDRLPGVVHNVWANVNKKFPRMRTAVLLLSVYVFMLLVFPFFSLVFLSFLEQ